MTGKYEHGVAKKANMTPWTTRITPIEFQSEEFGDLVLIDTAGFDYSPHNNELTRFGELCEWFRDKWV